MSYSVINLNRKPYGGSFSGMIQDRSDGSNPTCVPRGSMDGRLSGVMIEIGLSAMDMATSRTVPMRRKMDND